MSTWPICGDRCPKIFHTEPDERPACILPAHHRFDGEEWHTDGTALRWLREDERLTRRVPTSGDGGTNWRTIVVAAGSEAVA